MRRLPLVFLALLVSPAALRAQGTLYTDPLKRFTVQVPDGWTTEDLGDLGVTMSGNGLVWTISPLTGLNANQALTNMVDRISGAWTNLREFDRQSRLIGGQTATWIIFDAIDRDNKPGTVRALGIAGGGVTVGVLIRGEHAHYSAARATIEATLATLRLGSNPPFELPSPPVGSPTTPLASPASSASPSIGLEVRDIDDDEVTLLGLDDDRGALVETVEVGGAADRGGIRVHDAIIQVDRTKVEDAEEFERAVASYRVGDTIELLVTRHGQNERVSVRVEAAQP